MQGFSGWLLFAQAAKKCGADLTRRCVYDNLKKVHSGQVAASTLRPIPERARRANVRDDRSVADGFRLAKIGDELGIYDCSPKQHYKFKKSYGKGVNLGESARALNDLK